MENLNIIITGGSKGIGFAIAQAFGENHILHLIARKIKSFPESLHKQNIHLYEANLNSDEDILDVATKICQKVDKIDVLINNAGVYVEKPFAQTDHQEVTSLLQVNLQAPILLTQALLPQLQKSLAPLVINISSSSALQTPGNQTVYSASKAGLTAFSQALQNELNDLGIRISTIHPYAVNTWDDPNPKKLLSPLDIAKTVEFIVSAGPNCQVQNIVLNAV